MSCPEFSDVYGLLFDLFVEGLRWNKNDRDTVHRPSTNCSGSFY